MLRVEHFQIYTMGKKESKKMKQDDVTIKMINQVAELKDIVVDMQSEIKEIKESNQELIELYESEIDHVHARLNDNIEYR